MQIWSAPPGLQTRGALWGCGLTLCVGTRKRPSFPPAWNASCPPARWHFKGKWHLFDRGCVIGPSLCFLFPNKALGASGQVGLLGSVANGHCSGKSLGLEAWLCLFQGRKLLSLFISSALSCLWVRKASLHCPGHMVILRAAPAMLLATSSTSLVTEYAGIPLRPSEVRLGARTLTSYSVSLSAFEFLQTLLLEREICFPLKF